MNEKPMAKEWGISYASNFGGLESEEIWVTSDNREKVDEAICQLQKQAERGAISKLQLKVRHVTDWQPVEGQANG